MGTSSPSKSMRNPYVALYNNTWTIEAKCTWAHTRTTRCKRYTYCCPKKELCTSLVMTHWTNKRENVFLCELRGSVNRSNLISLITHGPTTDFHVSSVFRRDAKSSRHVVYSKYSVAPPCRPHMNPWYLAAVYQTNTLCASYACEEIIPTGTI